MNSRFKVTKGNCKDVARIKISGAKNAVLPLIIAKCLVPGKTIFKNAPVEIEDLKSICNILKFFGLNIRVKSNDLIIINNGISNNFANNNLTKYSRYSSLFFGILSKFNNFKIGWCGGCSIGSGRPLDIHFDGFKTFGFDIKQNGDFLEFIRINEGKNEFKMKFPSVGATFNCIFLGVQQRDFENITIYNCAIEPEIENVISFLNKAGYKIDLFKKQREIVIRKHNKVSNVSDFSILPDRIETITYCILSAILRKEIILENIDRESIKNSLKLLKNLGVNATLKDDKLILSNSNIGYIKNKKIIFRPYPGIPTDIQPLICVLLSFSDKKSILIDEVYPDRFEYISELNKANLKIIIKNGKIIVNPIKDSLRCVNFNMTDIRGGMACLILASYLVQRNNCEILIDNIYQIKRGYNNLITNFDILGIHIEEI